MIIAETPHEEKLDVGPDGRRDGFELLAADQGADPEVAPSKEELREDPVVVMDQLSVICVIVNAY